ncbi:MAG: DUF6728 family protein [Bacteroidia bacterium]
MSVFSKLLTYITFNRKVNSSKGNANLFLMHGINRISIFMFLIAVIVIIFRALTR